MSSITAQYEDYADALEMIDDEVMRFEYIIDMGKKVKDEDFPEIFKPFKEFSKLENCTVVALKQYPGQCLPWHTDTLVGIRKKFNIPEDVNVIRYSLVLEDWKWGHYYLAGNSIFHQWKQGDIIQMPPNM